MQCSPTRECYLLATVYAMAQHAVKLYALMMQSRETGTMVTEKMLETVKPFLTEGQALCNTRELEEPYILAIMLRFRCCEPPSV